MLKRQSHDINNLLKKMRAQYVTLQTNHDEQVHKIDDAYSKERQETMAQHRQDIEVSLRDLLLKV